MSRKIFLSATIMLGIVAGAAAYYLSTHSLPRMAVTTEDTAETTVRRSIFDRAEPTQVPPPFYELTIPYLRERTYSSELADLQEYSQSGSHTAYLTSYDSDGLRVNGLLTIPTGEEPDTGWPAIVFVHGYIPPSIYQTTENYNAYVNYFANRGFVVFKIDLRGHDQSEGEPGGAYYSSDYIIDTLNARAALQNADFVNPDAVGLWGHSMAGNVVFRALVSQQDIPASVIWAGAVYSYEDWEDYRLNDNSYRPPSDQSERRRRRQELFDTHGDFDPESTFWQQVVPTRYLEDVGGALQIHHAVNDTVVNVEYTRNLQRILNNTSHNIDFDAYEYQSGGHNISGAAFNSAMERSVDFFRKNLTNNSGILE